MQQLITQLKALQLIVVGTPKLDSNIHRVPTENNPKGKNGWYRGGSKLVNGKDIIWCTAGDWTQGDGALLNYKSWKDDNEFSATDREAIRQQQAESARKFEAEKTKRQKETAKKAQQEWLGLSETGESRYLDDKGVQAYGVRFGGSITSVDVVEVESKDLAAKNIKDDKYIAVPLRDSEGSIKSLQRIYNVKPEWASDKKYFLSGGEKKGLFHLIGDFSQDSPICFAEGYSTAASIYEATGYQTVVCFDAGNIYAVVKAWRDHHPDHDFIICADNDQWKGDKNTGKEKAEIAAKAFNCLVWLPDFTGLDIESKPTDFNDFHRLAGLESLTKVFTNFFLESKSFKNTSTTSTNENLPLTEFESANVIVKNVIAECGENPALLGGKKFQDALRLIRSEDAELYNYTYRPQLKAEKSSGVLLSQIESDTAPTSEGNSDGSIASELIDLVLSECALFFDEHNAEGKCFAVTQDGIERAFELNSSSFIEWLSYRYYHKTAIPDLDIKGKSASETAVKQACFALMGIAKHEGIKSRFFLRAAPFQDGHIIFVGNENHQVIEVCPRGWRVLNQSPVKFWKTKTMRELPLPVCGGDINKLWAYVNVSVADRPLVLAWMLEAWRENTPYPVLEFTGGQGTAKSSSQDRIRQLTDPNAVNLRAAPKTTEDIYTGAGNNLIVSFENISRLTPQQQDALCTLATGGGFASRKLYTNDEENVIEVKRPVIINSIPRVVTAQDLTDRVVSIELPTIENSRREESEIKASFEKDKAEILGGLLDLFAATLARLDSVKLDKPPRMADFTRLGEAMMQAQGFESGEFSELFRNNRAESVGKSLEASPVAMAILELSENHHKDVFYGSPKKLLELLEPFKSENDGWVRSPRGLSDVLRRQAPALSQFGITISISKTKQRTDNGVCYPITIKKIVVKNDFVDVVDIVDMNSKLLRPKENIGTYKVADSGVI